MGRPKRPRVENVITAATDPPNERHRGQREVTMNIPPPPCSDCYNEAMWGEGHLWSRNGVRSSWLNDVQWIQNISPRKMEHPVVHSIDIPMKEQIEAVNRQLCQIKRRLGPAADRCADACNTFRISSQCVFEEEKEELINSATTAQHEFEEARRSCNPFEELGEGKGGGLNRIFMNRAAIKLANIDALLEFSLTRHDGGGPFLFADICGAPGGFSEYILHRSRVAGLSSCYGYGMSLLGTNEHGGGAKWNIDHMNSLVGESYVNYCVCKGADDTGDIYNWENVEALRQVISSDLHLKGETSSKGKVHLVVADGGFDAQRDSECQEEVAQKIVVCQAAAAVALLQPGGTLLIKMFGFRSSTIRIVMEDLFNAFEEMTVVKPISSRPASAERYAVFTGYVGNLGADGLAWRNALFLGKTNNGCNEGMESTDVEERRCYLHSYLDTVDHNIVTLNSKACFEILSYIERKCQDMAIGEESIENNHLAKRQAVNIRSYKKAWQIT